uniref:Uncharacterized protein n=1 Tax=Strongyloides stercoralis TaxID=6248 RepID=A0A0K0DY79_STRER
MTETDGSTLANSSTIKATLKKDDSVPPYFVGISTPIKPFSKHPFITFLSIAFFSSISLTNGLITVFEKLLTES